MTFKEIQKAIKWAKKQGLSYLKTADFEFSSVSKAVNSTKSGAKSKKDEKIEGLTHDESAKMPNDSEMLLYSTEYFDHLRNSRKDPTPRS